MIIYLFVYKRITSPCGDNLLTVSIDRLAELSRSLSELYLSFNKLTVLDPCIGRLDRLLMLDLR